MSRYRLTVRYAACAFAGWGVTAQAASVQSQPSPASASANLSVIGEPSEAIADAGPGYLVSADSVKRAVQQVFGENTGEVHTATSTSGECGIPTQNGGTMCIVVGHRGTGSGGNPGGPSVSPTGGTSEPPPGEHDSGPPQGHSATTCFAPLKLLFRIKQTIVDDHEWGPPGDRDTAANNIALKGYVPLVNVQGGGTAISSTSGVTIGFGVDLHANDSPGILEAYPYLVPKGIVDQIAPAMGYVG